MTYSKADLEWAFDALLSELTSAEEKIQRLEEREFAQVKSLRSQIASLESCLNAKQESLAIMGQRLERQAETVAANLQQITPQTLLRTVAKPSRRSKKSPAQA